MEVATILCMFMAMTLVSIQHHSVLLSAFGARLLQMNRKSNVIGSLAITILPQVFSYIVVHGNVINFQVTSHIFILHTELSSVQFHVH